MTINLEVLANCNRPSGEWTYEIKNEQGAKCGEFRALILQNEDDLNYHFHFNSDGGFSGYRSQIQVDEIFPMALMESIDIPKDKRRQGHGGNGLLQFSKQAKEKGARCGFLKVSTSDEEPNRSWKNPFAAHFQKNICFYEKNGWILLINYGTSTVPFMYHSLYDFPKAKLD